MCGTYHPDLETHRRCMILAGVAPEQAMTYDDTGCGALMVWTFAYRCVDCGRWFHKTCIWRHFQENIEPPY